MPQPIMKKYTQGELGDAYPKKANPKNRCGQRDR